jgi:hypothetical protein
MLRLQNHSIYQFSFEFAERMLYAFSNLLYAYSNLLYVSNISINPIS